MNGKIIKRFIMGSIMLIGVFLLIPSESSANEMETGVKVTFSEEVVQEPPTQISKDPGVPSGNTTYRKTNGFNSGGGYSADSKRLPQTGEHFQEIFSKLGYFSLLMFLLCMFRRKKEEEESDKA